MLIINNDIKLITARGLLNKKTKRYVLDVLKKYDIKYSVCLGWWYFEQ